MIYYLLIGFSYYQIIVSTYETYQKSKYIYNTIHYFLPNQQENKPEKVIILKEEDEFIIIS